MDFMEATNYGIQLLAREFSAGKNIDKYWQRVLPEVSDFATNEIFLTLHRLHINELMKRNAAHLAQTVPPRDVDNLDNATLMLHYIIRDWWLRMSANSVFQALVDESRSIIHNTTDPIVWVKPSHIWLPQSNGTARQIYLSLVERYKQIFFARRCYAELVRRGQQNPYIKHTFILIPGSPDMPREQTEAHQWYSSKSKGIATRIGVDPAYGEDAGHDWLEELAGLPLHQKIQRVGATRIAIERDIIDMQRKGKPYEHVHFDDVLTDVVADESAKAPNKNIITDEYRQRLLECQTQIEDILSQRSLEAGKRRFQVILHMLMELPQKEIAKRVNAKEPTITKDKQVIRENWDQIQEVVLR